MGGGRQFDIPAFRLSFWTFSLTTDSTGFFSAGVSSLASSEAAYNNKI